MGTRVTGEFRGEATRRKILIAACEVIAEIGFEGVRMRIVAERAEVSSALLHYHFENREKLFLAALRFSFEHTGADDRTEPPADYPRTWLLARIIDACLPVTPELRRDFLLWQELWLRGSRDAESRALAGDLYLELREWAGSTIRDGIGSGEFVACEVTEVTDLLLALADGFGIRLILDDRHVTLNQARAQIWSVIGRELGITRPFPAARRATHEQTAAPA